MCNRLKEAVGSIKIIDDHGHPGFAGYFSNLPEDKRIAFATDQFKTPGESSFGFPYLKELHYEAYEKLYNFTRSEIDDLNKRNYLSELYEAKKNNLGKFVQDTMELAGVEKLLVNFVMPESLKGNSNLKFVPVLDPLLFPFDNSYLKKRVLGKSFVCFYEYYLEHLQKKYAFDNNGGYGEYLQFIETVISGQINEGCVALKFALSYVRSTYFERVDKNEGEDLYKKAKGGDIGSYIRLQDLLFWEIMKKAVKYDIPVQFHFSVTDNFVNYFDPINLSNVLEDAELIKAKIVILHAGYPRFDNAELLALGGLSPNNVYIDISGRIMFANHPRIIAKMLRKWLEKPTLWDKILYGSDTLWGERYIYTCSRTGRDAVYCALTGMINDEIIDEDTAVLLAQKILRENSLALYKL